MLRRIPYFLLALTAICIGLYPLIYFTIDRHFGLLSSKSDALLNNVIWNVGFYAHIICGGLALLVGWYQFNEKWRHKNIQLHKRIGKFYAYNVFISGMASVYIGYFATGGIVASTGFISLGLIWLYTTFQAVRYAKGGNIDGHQRMMIFSYAACFAAVTLRIWLPLLTTAFEGDFIKAYRIVAWLCWVPNLIFAWFLQARIVR